MSALSVKLKGIDWRGNVTHPSFHASLGKLISPIKALKSATGAMKNFIHPPGATPLTIAKTQLLGYRIDEASMKVIVQSIKIPLLGNVYNVDTGFHGLGGRLFSALLGGNMPFLANAQNMLDKYASLKETLAHPAFSINEAVGDIIDKTTDKAVGYVEGKLEGLPILSDMSGAILEGTGGAIRDIASQEIIGHLHVESISKSANDILDNIGIYNVDKITGSITDKATGKLIGKATQYMKGIQGISSVEKMLQDGSSSMINEITGAAEDFAANAASSKEIASIQSKLIRGDISAEEASKLMTKARAEAQISAPAVRIIGQEDILEIKNKYMDDEEAENKDKDEFAMNSANKLISHASTGYKDWMDKWAINEYIPQSPHGWG